MEDRYFWKKKPGNIRSNFNYIDLHMGKRFIIVDSLTGKTYPFPEYKEVRSEMGGYVKVNSIPHELWNQEFFNWICKTSPDFGVNIPKEFLTAELIDICINNSSHESFINEVPNLTQEQASRFVRRLPSAIKYLPVSFITDEMVLHCARHNIFNLSWVSSVVNIELIKNCYNLLDYSEKPRFVIHVSDRSFFTSELLEDLLNHKTRVSGDKIEKDFWNVIPSTIITKSIAKKMVKLQGSYIKYVPDELLDEEIVESAVFSNGKALLYVPERFKSENICMLAFDNNVEAIRYMPEAFKSYSVCKRAVITKPPLINCVPASILTLDFYNELVALGIVVPAKSVGYVKACLDVHNEAMKDDIKTDNKANEKASIDISNITFNDIRFFFSPTAIKHLDELGINSLTDLFELGRDPKFATIFASTSVYPEVSGTIRLLRCKYLNEDPLVDMYSEDENIRETYNALGLSKRSFNSLVRTGFAKTGKHFFERLSSPTAEEELNKVRNVGPSCVSEIIQKVNIVREFYANKKAIDDIQTLSELKDELQRLQSERDNIDSQIEAVLARIKEYEAMQTKTKGVTLS